MKATIETKRLGLPDDATVQEIVDRVHQLADVARAAESYRWGDASWEFEKIPPKLVAAGGRQKNRFTSDMEGFESIATITPPTSPETAGEKIVADYKAAKVTAMASGRALTFREWRAADALARPDLHERAAMESAPHDSTARAAATHILAARFELADKERQKVTRAFRAAKPKIHWRRAIAKNSDGRRLPDDPSLDALRAGRDSGKWPAGISVSDGWGVPLKPGEIDYAGFPK